MNTKTHKMYMVRWATAIMMLLMVAPLCHALDGAWRGDITVNSTKIPLVFNFSSSETGAVSCTLDSPMQGVRGMATDVAYCKDDSVAVDIASIGATYRGRISKDAIRGTFTQRGFSFALDLEPELSAEERRPQTPRAPFPYTTIDTTFATPDGAILAATITLPNKAAKGCPAVVMITGSGPQNRDEELFDHKPFAVIADYLARHGIASLRYDDRGTAQSTGDFNSADIDTFHSDAKAAIRFMKGINKGGRTGALGHSEGGTIALMLGADGEAGFVVCLAAAACDGKDMILAQNRRVLENTGLTERQTADGLTLLSLAFDDIIAGTPYTEIPLDSYIAERKLEIAPFLLASLRQNLTASSSNYFRTLLSLRPSQWLGTIHCPVWAGNGTLDTQVVSSDNLPVIKANVPDATVKEYPGLNHLFQHAATGEIDEYINITETISSEVLNDMVTFIDQQD